MSLKLILLGCGTVGLKFLELLQEKKSDLNERYNLEIAVVGAGDSTGAAMDERGLNLEQLINIKRQTGKVGLYPGNGVLGLSGKGALEKVQADIVIEAGVTDTKTGGVSLEHAKTALSFGRHVIFLSKGPLVCAYPELKQLALANNVQMKLSGATAAALPTMDVALHSLAGTHIQRFQGILNGTSNYILTQMAQAGVSYAEALREAQKKGIAETDPVLDVEGWDTASKILILANAVMDADLTIDQIDVNGMTDITLEEIHRAKQRSKVIKLIGEASRMNGEVKVSVAPMELDGDHPLARVHDGNKGIHFETDTMGALTVIGGKSDPKAAAAAALKDMITLVRRM